MVLAMCELFKSLDFLAQFCPAKVLLLYGWLPHIVTNFGPILPNYATSNEDNKTVLLTHVVIGQSWSTIARRQITSVTQLVTLTNFISAKMDVGSITG
jgi:hypothetical protein